MIKIGRIIGSYGKFYYIGYYDKIMKDTYYMSSQIATLLNLDVDQLNEMFSGQGGINDNGLYQFTNIDDARRAKEELENVILMNTIVGFEF